jgi:hypothetical protein
MPWNTPGVLTAVQAILTGIPGLNQVYKGVPESIGRRVVAVVAIGGQRIEYDAMRVLERQVGVYVEFAYRVAETDTDVAEDTLAGFLDAFLTAFYADQTLAGTCEWSDLDFSLANDPNYRPTAGQEFRVFPFAVWARQTNAV